MPALDKNSAMHIGCKAIENGINEVEMLIDDAELHEKWRAMEQAYAEFYARHREVWHETEKSS